MLARLRCWLSLGHNYIEVAEARWVWERVAYPPWIAEDEYHTVRSPVRFCARCGKESTHLRVPDYIFEEFTWQPGSAETDYGARQ